MLALEHYLGIVEFWLNHKMQKLLLNPFEDIVACLIELGDSDVPLSDGCIMKLSGLFSSLLVNRGASIEIAVRHQIIQKVVLTFFQ